MGTQKKQMVLKGETGPDQFLKFGRSIESPFGNVDTCDNAMYIQNHTAILEFKNGDHSVWFSHHIFKFQNFNTPAKFEKQVLFPSPHANMSHPARMTVRVCS